VKVSESELELGIGLTSRGSRLLGISYERSDMLNPQKTLERETLLKRLRELDAAIAQHERNLREGEARLPVEEQLRLKLRRLIESEMPELATISASRIQVVSASTNIKIRCWCSLQPPHKSRLHDKITSADGAR
jgi:hypothetical protein